jgi:hypothetical protein
VTQLFLCRQLVNFSLPSKVQSLTLDSWSEAQLAMMKVGGNARAGAYYKACGIDKHATKYGTPAAVEYRKHLDAQSKVCLCCIQVKWPFGGTSHCCTTHTSARRLTHFT